MNKGLLQKRGCENTLAKRFGHIRVSGRLYDGVDKKTGQHYEYKKTCCRYVWLDSRKFFYLSEEEKDIIIRSVFVNPKTGKIDNYIDQTYREVILLIPEPEMAAGKLLCGRKSQIKMHFYPYNNGREGYTDG